MSAFMMTIISLCKHFQAVKKSPKSQVMEERIDFVNKCFTCDLYREIDMCLEKKDMLAAAFVLAVQMKPIEVFIWRPNYHDFAMYGDVGT